GVSASAGQVVSAGQTVFTVASSNARDVVFDVASPGIVSRQPGATFHVALLQDASVIAQAHLRDISPQADPQTRSWRVRITLDNPPPDMVMGASVSVTLPIADSAGEKVITRLPLRACQKLLLFSFWIRLIIRSTGEPYILQVTLRTLFLSGLEYHPEIVW
ncbi:HlyD family efflux transporter periplasmic adaptor subunit, partial [Klebsiella pneumoniae]|uniref:HlyD family efflux transporter periplasmic adaptor subunit n=1 Tax=Klebsiella pneumoniae TaxID=573 RepID=UPI00301A7D60